MIAEFRAKSTISNTLRSRIVMIIMSSNYVLFAINLVAVISSDRYLLFWLILQSTYSSISTSSEYSSGTVDGIDICIWLLVNNAELLIIIRGSGGRRQRTLLLKFSFSTTLLHIWERTICKRTTESLSFLAVKMRMQGLPDRLSTWLAL